MIPTCSPTACSASVHLLEKHRLLCQLYCRAMQYSNIFNMHFFLKQHTQLPTLISHASCRASEWSPAPAAFHRPKEVAVVEALCSPCQGLDWENCTNELTSNSLSMSCHVLPCLGSFIGLTPSPRPLSFDINCARCASANGKYWAEVNGWMFQTRRNIP